MSSIPSTSSTPQDQAPPAMPEETFRYLQWLFAWHGLTIRQKVLAIAQKYYVYDDQGTPRFFVVRPPKVGLNVVAGIAGLVINIMALILAFQLLFRMGQFIPAIAVFFIGGWIAGLVRILIAPYRDIRVYTDESQTFQVMLISQDNKFGLHKWFTIFDAAGEPVARARRNQIASIWRRQWVAETNDERQILRVREDSLLLAILRRYLGPLWGALRTNFDFILPEGTRIGEYNRKLTIRDIYILDLHQDPYYLVDRRVALALAILLDTAEGR